MDNVFRGYKDGSSKCGHVRLSSCHEILRRSAGVLRNEEGGSFQ